MLDTIKKALLLIAGAFIYSFRLSERSVGASSQKLLLFLLNHRRSPTHRYLNAKKGKFADPSKDDISRMKSQRAATYFVLF